MFALLIVVNASVIEMAIIWWIGNWKSWMIEKHEKSFMYLDCVISFIEAHLHELTDKKASLKLIFYKIHETWPSPSKIELTVITGSKMHKGIDMTSSYYRDGDCVYCWGCKCLSGIFTRYHAGKRERDLYFCWKCKHESAKVLFVFIM